MSNASMGGGIAVDLNQPDTVNLSREAGVFPIKNDNRAQVRTLDDLALTAIKLDDFPAAKDWRRRLFDPAWIPEICDELPRLLTEFMRSNDAKKLSSTMRRAKALHYVFSNKMPLVNKESLLPGQTTTSFVGPVVYPEMIGYCIWPELRTVSTRAQNPFNIKPEVAERLNREIFPFWLEYKTVSELARSSEYDTQNYPDLDVVRGAPSIDPPLYKHEGQTPKCQELMERVAFYLTDKGSTVSHTVPDFERLLKYGLDGLIAQAKADQAHAAPEAREFLEGVITVFEGAKNYAARLAEAAGQCGNTKLAAICRKVPANPPSTLHEALVSIWICYHLLLQENTNFGFSIGRLDQLVNAYYLQDWSRLQDEQSRQDYIRDAVELMCHFFLKCTDHVPLSTEAAETLFAGSGSNQALTVGGLRMVDGNMVDAVNDMTYIILKATELLAIRDPNVHARYHPEIHHRDAQGNRLPDGVMDNYLKRICQVNILTRATPALHNDAAVIPSMEEYYGAYGNTPAQEALADACDYSSIGCIEQNSAGKHYGNTGSSLVVLPAVLELALYGGKHRSDGVGPQDPNLFYGTPEYTSPLLTQMKSMEEFISAFRFQLDEMARHAVQCNNYLGRFLEQERPSPFLSGLFTGPTNVPGGQGAKFRDLSAGGAKYNSAGVAIIGLADVIDSFTAVDALVFGGKISAEELLAALQEDFSGEERSFWQSFVATLKRWLNIGQDGLKLKDLTPQQVRKIVQEIRHTPKYGAGVVEDSRSPIDNALAVKYTHLLTRMIHETFFKYRTHRGGRYLAGYWSMTNHAGFGMLAQASPNGRKAGLSFASGITPCSGIAKRNGEPVILLDHMRSVTSVDPLLVKNGYTYNLSLTTRGSGQIEADTSQFSRYMKTFADEKGVLVQMCVSSIAELQAADQALRAAAQPGAGEAEQKALQPYKDLMIRVAGYSAYFVSLGPQMRAELIARANFALANGQETNPLPQ
ncbi:MAG TPA: pyruvate formate lyase family protein [Gallionellaceae bacterium]